MKEMFKSILVLSLLMVFAVAAVPASAADRIADLPSRTDPSLPMVPWLREGFPKSLHVPIHNEIPLPDDQTRCAWTPPSPRRNWRSGKSSSGPARP